MGFINIHNFCRRQLAITLDGEFRKSINNMSASHDPIRGIDSGCQCRSRTLRPKFDRVL